MATQIGQTCPKCGANNVRMSGRRNAVNRALAFGAELAEGATTAIVDFRCQCCLHRFEADLVKTMDRAGFEATNRMRKRRGFPPLER